jgi:hypothetical protein
MRKLSFLLFTIVLTACSLDEHPRDQIPEEEAYTSAKKLFNNTVATLYNYIGGSKEGEGLQGTGRCVWDLQTFGSDEALIPTRGTDWYDGGIWQAMYKHSWNAGHEIVNNSWLYLYKVITLCNRSLATLDAHRELAGFRYYEWRAEIRALRAIYYWYLIDLFGDVPLVVSNDVSMNDVKRSPRAEVFQFCVDELKYCDNYLSFENSASENEFYGRITLTVSYFVLAKLMLNSAVYTGQTDVSEYYEECIDYCDQLESMGFQLQENMEDNFILNNQQSKENIFTIPMDKYHYSNVQQNLIRSLHSRHAAAFGFTGENGISATLETLKTFGYNTEETDSRFEVSFYADVADDPEWNPILDRTGKQLQYYPDKVKMDLTGSPYLETAGARMRKYQLDKNSAKGGQLVENDIVLFRFADVLLMRAEAKLRLGQDGQEDYDRVRQRSAMLPRPCTLDNILKERLLELCWEGWRRQDLIRFGKYKSLYEGDDAVDESDGHTTIFPIPADILTLNPNIKQNPGY